MDRTREILRSLFTSAISFNSFIFWILCLRNIRIIHKQGSNGRSNTTDLLTKRSEIGLGQDKDYSQVKGYQGQVRVKSGLSQGSVRVIRIRVGVRVIRVRVGNHLKSMTKHTIYNNINLFGPRVSNTILPKKQREITLKRMWCRA